MGFVILWVQSFGNLDTHQELQWFIIFLLGKEFAIFKIEHFSSQIFIFGKYSAG